MNLQKKYNEIELSPVENKNQILNSLKNPTPKGQSGDKKKVGRPHKEKDKKRDKQMVIYLTEEEYKQIDNQAKLQNITLSQYIRDTLLNGGTQVRHF